MAVSAGALVKAREGLYKLVYYETTSWGSAGTGNYATGGAPVTVSTLKRVAAVVAASLLSSQGARLEWNPIGANTNQVTLRAYGASGDEVVNAKTISGIMRVAMLVLGE